MIWYIQVKEIHPLPGTYQNSQLRKSKTKFISEKEKNKNGKELFN